MSIDEQPLVTGLCVTPRLEDPFVAAVLATRTPMVITNPRLHDNPIVYANDAFLDLTGYHRHEILGRNCRFLQGPDTSEAEIGTIRDALAVVKEVETDLLNYRKDGRMFWNRLLITPVFEGGVLTFHTASQQDVTIEKEDLVRLEARNVGFHAELSRWGCGRKLGPPRR